MKVRHLLGACILAVWALAGVTFGQSTVLNYFSPCSAGASTCDNILNITGTWKIGSTAVTATAGEINALASGGISAAEAVVLGGYTASAAEVNALTGAGLSGAEATQLGLITLTGAQVNLAVQGVAGGYKVARGETALDGSNPTTVATGLATIVTCIVSQKGTAAPGLGTSHITFDWSAANLSAYAWKPTAQGDTTLVASTGTETFGWICSGT